MEDNNDAFMHEMDMNNKEVFAQSKNRQTEEEGRMGAAGDSGLKFEGKPKRAKRDRDKTMLGSAAMKIFLFFLMTISFLVIIASAFVEGYMVDNGVYEREDEFKRQIMSGQIWNDYDKIRAFDTLELFNMEKIENIVDGDVKLRLVRYEDSEELWSNYNGFDTPYTYQIHCSYRSYAEKWGLDVLKRSGYDDNSSELKEYVWEFYVDPDFPCGSGYLELWRIASILYERRYLVIAVLVSACLAFILSFILLMCSAGHHNGKNGVSPSLLNFVPIDLYAGIWIWIAFVVLFVGAQFLNYAWDGATCATVMIFGTFEVIWGTAFAMEVMTRLKLGGFCRNTIIYRLLRLIVKIFKLISRGLLAVISGIPQIVNNLIAFFGICILELIGIMIFCEAEIFVLWLIEKVILLPVLLYFSLCQARLKEAGEALAEGNMSYKLDTSRMILDQKEHGENLNSIAQGINTAVEERMKSERLKTELITNVSHDIKTPLTSIINYSDLIVNESTDNARINEYAEVLNRQSMRLKKLLDDLLEASKATTGNLDVNLQPCEVGVMLTQTIGEYEHRFEEKGLKLVAKQPETPVKVQADSRHMWRIFDNLMNNICKYAMEDSRVYLTVERCGGMVNIVFRNMSKYELDISSDELTERFARGDRSRHIEGNGLGLSIAASLAELQNGTMSIVTDGDLFKVILAFPVLADE